MQKTSTMSAELAHPLSVATFLAGNVFGANVFFYFFLGAIRIIWHFSSQQIRYRSEFPPNRLVIIRANSFDWEEPSAHRAQPDRIVFI